MCMHFAVSERCTKWVRASPGAMCFKRWPANANSMLAPCWRITDRCTFGCENSDAKSITTLAGTLVPDPLMIHAKSSRYHTRLSRQLTQEYAWHVLLRAQTWWRFYGQLLYASCAETEDSPGFVEAPLFLVFLRPTQVFQTDQISIYLCLFFSTLNWKRSPTLRQVERESRGMLKRLQSPAGEATGGVSRFPLLLYLFSNLASEDSESLIISRLKDRSLYLWRCKL